MAKFLPKRTIEASPQLRTRHVEIITEYGKPYVIRAHREELVLSATAEVFTRDNSAEVVRALSDIQGESFTCRDGTVVSVPHLQEAIAGLIDKWETEDGLLV